MLRWYCGVPITADTQQLGFQLALKTKPIHPTMSDFAETRSNSTCSLVRVRNGHHPPAVSGGGPRRALQRIPNDGRRMGRYKDYREPKRRGYDDDYIPQDRVAERRPSSPRPSTPQASEPVEAIVKWFNAEKGFGFVAVVGGSEAFMHIRVLEAAGHSGVPEGARVKVRIGQGLRGPQVSELIEVDKSPAPAASTSERRIHPRLSSQRQPGVGATEECVGSVKWYNAHKGFGFIGQESGGKDVFVHATTLERGGLSGLTEGQRVRMQISQGQKGPEARSIEFLD
jgi:CspA family cold shock protein